MCLRQTIASPQMHQVVPSQTNLARFHFLCDDYDTHVTTEVMHFDFEVQNSWVQSIHLSQKILQREKYVKEKKKKLISVYKYHKATREIQMMNLSYFSKRKEVMNDYFKSFKVKMRSKSSDFNFSKKKWGARIQCLWKRQEPHRKGWPQNKTKTTTLLG